MANVGLVKKRSQFTRPPLAEMSSKKKVLGKIKKEMRALGVNI